MSWVDRRHTEAEAYETALPEGCVFSSFWLPLAAFRFSV
jgi:hypothetical protein